MKTLLRKFFTHQLVTGMLLFACYGLCNEILFTGISAWISGNFRGEVSLLMFPVYAISYLLLSSGIGKWIDQKFPNIFLRSLMVVVVVYLVEGISGNLYFLMGLEPWRYHHGWASDFSNGAISLLYAPFWYIFAFLVVRIGDIIEAISPVVDEAVAKEGKDFVADLRESINRRV